MTFQVFAPPVDSEGHFQEAEKVYIRADRDGLKALRDLFIYCLDNFDEANPMDHIHLRDCIMDPRRYRDGQAGVITKDIIVFPVLLTEEKSQ